MRPALLLATLAWAVTASAQVPTYVPTDGLVGWFPLDGNIVNEVNGAVGNTISTTAEPDRNGQASASLGFNGSAYGVLNNAGMPTGEFSVSAWVKQSQSWSTGNGIEFICVGSASNTAWGTIAGPEFIHLNRGRGCSGNGQVLSGVNFPLNEWVHLTYVCAGIGANADIYLNGEYAGQSLNLTSGSCGSSNLYFGVDIFSAPEYITGGLDDVGIWNRGLSAIEAQALFTEIPPITGCTEEGACNYDNTATIDDGSCIPSGCMDEGACNYNADAECEGEACDYSCCPGPGCCGEGMHWDAAAQTCVITPPSVAPDTECTLLNLQELAEGYQILLAENAELDSLLADCNGTSTSDQSGPCSGEDVVTYHGYDYDIVEIGDQCWFAENLRNTSYSDGTTITHIPSTSDWANQNSGAWVAYDNDAQNADTFGLLYNWFAVNDTRGICPAGWSVPSDSEWLELDALAGIPPGELNGTGNRGAGSGAGTKWKASSPNWNGTDDFGLKAIPGGVEHEHGGFAYLLQEAYWWTASEGNATDAWRRAVKSTDIIDRRIFDKRAGMSVRCVKD